MFAHQIQVQSMKAVADFFVFVDFNLYYTEPDSPHGGLFESGSLFVRKRFEGEVSLERGGLIESLRYF